MTLTSLDFLSGVDLRLTVELGRTRMTLGEVLALGENSVVALERLTDEPLDMLVNGKVIARGEVVPVNGRFALRIVEMLGGASAATGANERIAGAIPADPAEGEA